jgi:hypothetical protein
MAVCTVGGSHLIGVRQLRVQPHPRCIALLHFTGGWSASDLRPTPLRVESSSSVRTVVGGASWVADFADAKLPGAVHFGSFGSIDGLGQARTRSGSFELKPGMALPGKAYICAGTDVTCGNFPHPRIYAFRASQQLVST